MKREATVACAEVVDLLCRELKYSRSHVATMLRKNRAGVGARRKDGRWLMPRSSIARLRRVIKLNSGRRYKLGERGPHL